MILSTTSVTPSELVDVRVHLALQLECATRRASYEWGASPEVATRVRSRLLKKLAHWSNRFGQNLPDLGTLYARLDGIADRAIGRELRRQLRTRRPARIEPVDGSTSARSRQPIHLGDVVGRLFRLSPLQWQILYLLDLKYSTDDVSTLLRISPDAVLSEASGARKIICRSARYPL
jgi:hypothetical protein